MRESWNDTAAQQTFIPRTNVAALSQTLSSTYSREEFIINRQSYQWAEYLLQCIPDILRYKPLLEAIRKTKQTNILFLENDGSQGFVVQISDICIKFRKEESTDDNFDQEYKNYLTIEDIYTTHQEELSGMSIPGLQRHLCTADYVTMEYVPGLTLTTHFVLKDKKVTTDAVLAMIQKGSRHSDGGSDEARLVCQRLQTLSLTPDTIMDHIKDHELRTLLIHHGIVPEGEFENVAHLDTNFLVEYVTSTDMMRVYEKWKEILDKEWIASIDDHGDNLKFHNGILYALDFGKMEMRKKRS